MYSKIDLSGVWNFQLDEEKLGVELPYSDTITLPSTTSFSKKGKINENIEIGSLTDTYKFEGYAWFSRSVDISKQFLGKKYYIYLERTRVTTLWIDGVNVGTKNNLCVPHVYDCTNYLSAGKHTITILVDNTNYPTKGGHLTSSDTQTNWNGITGKIELQIFDKIYIKDLQIYSNIENKAVTIKAKVIGADKGIISVSAANFNGEHQHKVEKKEFRFDSNNININYSFGEDALLWSEYEPNLYKLSIELKTENLVVADKQESIIGLREFKAMGDKFSINGVKTFLRGKHEGLIFPLTGFAPTNVEEWLKVLKISKSYGINHYRFHTCCPPEAAFVAADMLGIYLEPELPFWGTITDENDEKHNEVEQKYLIEEGLLILSHFGNHPSFVMMSLGNELWGSKDKLNEILKKYKQFDNRHLYTQGSNNFQFDPVILENDDFFCGVRFSKKRLIRGSYAMCDAPLGHVQTNIGNTKKDYDENIIPASNSKPNKANLNIESTIEIQFGTEVKRVKANNYNENLIPKVPVISHEIGQYETYPNFKEIEKYKGSIKAKNLEEFKDRLEKKGMSELAQKYFSCSGKLAVACYKEELEAAFRTKKLAGFQLLDLQDFSGQGTALVGILDAFMESKGIVSKEEWATFCSDAVLMARFSKYNYLSEEKLSPNIELCYYRNIPLRNFMFVWEIKDEEGVYDQGGILASNQLDENYIDIGEINIEMPKVTYMKKLTLSMKIDNTNIEKTYDLWVYPKEIHLADAGLNIYHSLSEKAILQLEKGEKVVIFPREQTIKNSIEGFYSSDFWCYPMFRSISESMNKEVPIGTMGLLIDNVHPIFKDFPTEEFSTYQWESIVSNSCSIILDDAPKNFLPIVQTIDNFERNHKLGLVFECKVSKGKLLLCSCDFEKILEKPEAKQLLFSIFNYAKSEDFNPKVEIGIGELRNILE